VGLAGVQDATPTLVVSAEPQDVVTQLLPLVAVMGLQLATALSAGLLTVHKVAVKLFPTAALTGVQV
jgi:hypothetical protein